MATMIDRMIRAAKLDVDLYNEVEADTSLNQEALMVVILVSVIGGIGSFLGGIVLGKIGSGLLWAILTVLRGVIFYYVWAYVTYFVGTRVFGGTADVGEMLRTLGYAYTPQLLSLLSFIPCVGPVLAGIGFVWSLVAFVIAIREALDFDTIKAIITAVIGWLIMVIINGILGLFGIHSGLGELKALMRSGS